MKVFRSFIFFITILLLYTACTPHSNEIEELFNKVEDIVEQHPDSALVLLKSIRNPYKLNKAQYNHYILLTVQAKDKNYEDISSDSLIFSVKDYYTRKNDDLKKRSLAEFYSGRVFQSQGNLDEAMANYLQSAENAEESYLYGLAQSFIGHLFYDQLLLNEAIMYYQRAIEAFTPYEDIYINHVYYNLLIGNCFLIEELPDSAFLYYQKSLEIAEKYNDNNYKSKALLSLGAAYMETGDMENAKSSFMKAVSNSTDKDVQIKTYMNLTDYFINENQPDSALYYADLALNLSDDIDTKLNILYFLSEIEEQNGNYRKSLEYHRQYTSLLGDILEKKRDIDILDIQKKYDFELLQNANKTLIIQRLWIAFLAILLLSAIAFVFYRKHAKNKEALLTAKQQIYQLKKIIDKNSYYAKEPDRREADDKNRDLRELLFKFMDIYKNIHLLEGYLLEEDKKKGKNVLKKVNEIIFDPEKKNIDWKIFYEAVNALHNNFLIRLQELYPLLDETDIQMCCLTKIGFNNTEIALLTGVTPVIAQKRKNPIREKTGMKKGKSFNKQLEELIK